MRTEAEVQFTLANWIAAMEAAKEAGEAEDFTKGSVLALMWVLEEPIIIG